MRTERFTGKTLLEAVRRARETCGPGALVVSARGPAERGWIGRLRPRVYEVRVRPAAEPPMRDLHELAARIDALTLALERNDRLAEEVVALREAVAALGGRPEPEAVGPPPGRPRLSQVRGGSEAGARILDPTARSADAWNRSSSNS